MEAIVGQSTFFRAVRRLTLVGVIIVGLSDCSQPEATRHPMLNRPSTSQGFERYTLYYEGDNTFKAFVLSNSGAWSWRIRPTPQAAIDDALTSCAANSYLAGCRLFAIGNTIVWDMSEREREDTIANYELGKTKLDLPDAPLSSSALWGFEIYLNVDDCEKFKVFLLAENGAWTQLERTTYEEVLKDAFNLCDIYAGRPGLCRFYAVGNTVVWGTAEDEIAEVIEDYRKPRKCE